MGAEILKRKRPTVGVLVGWQVYAAYLHSYFTPLLNGIIAAAQHRECNLLLACDVIRDAKSDSPRAAWPIVSPDSDFVPVGPWNTDGVIVILPLFAEEQSRYAQEIRAEGHPVVFLGSGEEGPTVTVDNESGIRQAVSHLVEHGHRRIAFVAGYEGDPPGDGRERLAAYRAVIRDQGLELDPDLIAYSQHARQGGGRAMRRIIASGAPFTAVVASNDESGFGAMAALESAGLRIPQDVAVIGFDDIHEARAQEPSLTSIHIPKFDMGYRALDFLLDRILGQAGGQEAIRVPVWLTVRESCGCYLASTSSLPAGRRNEEGDAAPTPDRLAHAIAERVGGEGQRLPRKELHALGKRLVNAFAQSLEESDEKHFIIVLREALRRTEASGSPSHLWQDAVSALREALPSLLLASAFGGDAQADSDRIRQADRILDEARVAISESVDWSHRQYVLSRNRTEDQISMLGLALRAARDEEQMLRELGTYLSLIDVERAAVGFYQPEGGDRFAHCLLYAVSGQAVESVRFPTRQFPPRVLCLEDKPFGLALLPLMIDEDVAGFMTFDTANLVPCANVVRQLVVEYERRRVQRLLEHQARELVRSNIELSRFAYVASHDLQEPLRMVTSFLQLLQRRYGGQLDADADEFIGYAVDGAARMHALIMDLLEYSRVGTHGKPLTPTDCTDILERTLANLRVSVEESGATVTHDELPTVMADAGQIAQLLQNLIGNAIKFRSDRAPQVHVSAERDDGAWLFSVRDNGIGFEAEYRDRIFVAFQRLHDQVEYPGNGIGLAICKKIIERHGGQIWADSRPGEGSTFYFTIPDDGAEDASRASPEEHGSFPPADDEGENLMSEAEG